MSLERILQKCTDKELIELWEKIISMDFMNDKTNFSTAENILICFENEVKKRKI